ncbi:MAG TPA: ABC transporter permease, partial [Fervidobacterium sp.]|nr:ABC transporter permease [Fervidobacterium sp.]
MSKEDKDKKKMNNGEQNQQVTTPSEENVDFEEVYLSRGQLMWRAFRKNRLAMVGMWILIVMYIAMI